MQAAQAENVRLVMVMKSKQLTMHPDKTGFIVFGSRAQKKNSVKELKVNPIIFDKYETKAKDRDKWLGDIFDVDATI